MANEEKGNITPEEVLKRLQAMEGSDTLADPDTPIVSVTEFDLAMASFKLANAAINALVSRGLYTMEEIFEILAESSRMIDKFTIVVDEEEE